MVRIVAVDDDAELLSLLAEIFALEGWELIPCTSAKNAVGVIERERPDVVVLDLWLETMSAGVDVRQELADHESTSAIPVICCTGLAESVLRKELRVEPWWAGVVRKPFDLDVLVAAVNAALAPPPRSARFGPTSIVPG